MLNTHFEREVGKSRFNGNNQSIIFNWFQIRGQNDALLTT